MVLQHSRMHFSNTLIKEVKTINSTPPKVPLFLVGFVWAFPCEEVCLFSKVTIIVTPLGSTASPTLGNWFG